MPSRPPSSKSAKAKPDSIADEEVVEGAPAKKPAAKKDVLSLIEEVKPKKRAPRKDATDTLPAFGAKPAPKVPIVEAPPEPPRRRLDDAKREALNIFEDDDKPKVRRARTTETPPLPALVRLPRTRYLMWRIRAMFVGPCPGTIVMRSGGADAPDPRSTR